MVLKDAYPIIEAAEAKLQSNILTCSKGLRDRLRVLDISGHNLLGYHQQRRVIDLSGLAELTQAITLAGSPQAPAPMHMLHTLDLGHNKLFVQGLLHVMSWFKSTPNLRVVRLNHTHMIPLKMLSGYANTVDPDDAASMSKKTKAQKAWSKLEISDDDDVVPLKEERQDIAREDSLWSKVGGGLDADNADNTVVKWLEPKSKQLRLEEKHFNCGGAEALGHALEQGILPRLQELDVRGNGIRALVVIYEQIRSAFKGTTIRDAKFLCD